MRTYDKRIGFIVSSQTLIPHGGIGQFAKSFCELMSEHNIKVDIITDKEPKDNEFAKSLKANIIAPTTSLPYTDHSNIFMYGDTFCYERMANFRNAIIKALERNLYDVLICNTYESIQVASTMGLEDCIQIIAYTHLESQIFKDTKNPFLHSTNEMMRKQLEMNGLWIGTQSKFNQISMSNGVWHLPIPITERGLLEKHYKPRDGVLFVGRWEEGKNPELFIELIEQTKLPAKVMTSPNGVKKFEDRLKKIGVSYDIRASIVGKEKVDFITSARVAFNPSTVESYGMAFYEQIIQLPTFCLENQRWTKNFDGKLFFETNKKEMAQDVQGAYERFATAEDWYGNGSALANICHIENSVFRKWSECFSEFTTKQSNTNTAKICSETTVKLQDFIKELNRSVICIDDIKSVLTNKHKYRVIYSDSDTYLSKDPQFSPEEKEEGLSLFDGI
jgi:glycosyltransferase involved in cell wall biosynthesis